MQSPRVTTQTASGPADSARAYETQTASGSLLSYDPFMDNHLEAPVAPQGVFGLPVRDVERILRGYGAKPYSYSFGKESRMLLAAYIVTIRFDRARHVGSIIIEPKAPVRSIGSNARAFFTELFLSGIDPSRFKTLFTPEKISISYDPSSSGPTGSKRK